jgi:hypothetical protein
VSAPVGAGVTKPLPFFIALLIAICTSASGDVLLSWQANRYVLLNGDASGRAVAPVASRADLDRDGVKEAVTITCGWAVLRRGKSVLWRSDVSWRVTHALFADANHDGRTELVLVVWKRGTWGPDKPFFVRENDNRWGCHVFVYAWRAKALRLIWGSSAIDYPIREIAFADLRGDGQPDLIVLESPGATVGAMVRLRSPQVHESPASHLAVWRWNGWGFSNEFRSPKGRYSSLRVVPGTGRDVVKARGSARESP